ncbi:hypothetical protein [Leuconostoc mesenteroides]|uniref:hypothetical protein n=1 Tax=Leuconostoc mesenteroides TaxID=1245 RepID=UPI0021A66D69|nr:hypothetical protein [Leuconostoc mesenteroides]MCT3053928.1 hypothetical protein [Leuconostoc mesenteroides]
MILTLGFMVATTLQPYSVDKLDNVVTLVHVQKDATVHISHASDFEIIVDKGGEAIKAADGKQSMNVKAKAGTTLHISALSGWNKDTYYKVGHQVVNVRAYKNVGY